MIHPQTDPPHGPRGESMEGADRKSMPRNFALSWKMVRDGGSRQKAGFGLAENKLGLRPERGNAPGVIGVKMREEHRLRVNVQAR